jgi:phenylacetate-CoA ligase
MDKVARIHASSGTTGQPTVVGYTRGDLDRWSNLVARSIHVAGGRPGMKVHVAYGYGLFTGGLGAHYGAEVGGFTVIPMSGGQTERQVQLIADFEPDILMMTPSYALAVVDEFRRQGLDPRSEFALHPGGPTVWEDHFLPEIVDPDTGAVLPDGERGELVFTSLTKEAMPVIRYRTRDLTRLVPGVASPMRRIERIVGRSDDMLIIRGVNVFPTQIEGLLLRCEGLAAHYEMVLTRPDRLDELLVRVEPRPDRAAEHHARDAHQLAALIKDNVGVSAKIEICVVGALPRSAGKQAHVKDLRGATK